MFHAILIACLLVAGTVLARPADPSDVTIVRYENVHEEDGGYRFVYETSDGSMREESGHVINAGTENEAIAVEGSFSYLGPDGVQVTVHYVADENGFQPQVAHSGRAGGARSVSAPKAAPKAAAAPVAQDLVGSLLGA